jgi:hypothetical protein
MNVNKTVVPKPEGKRLIICLVSFAVIYGSVELLPPLDYLLAQSLELFLWAVFFITCSILVVKRTDKRFSLSGVFNFFIALILILFIILLAPWTAMNLIAPYIMGPVIFQMTLFYSTFVSLLCIVFGIFITLAAATKTIPQNFKLTIRNLLGKTVLVAIVSVILMNLELPIALNVPEEFAAIYFCISGITTQLIFALVYYPAITSFMAGAQPFSFPWAKAKQISPH